MAQGKFLLLFLGLSFTVTLPGLCLPPLEDLPEEVLRMEIITEARSPIDGKPMTAAEYAQIQAQLKERNTPPALDPNIQEVIFLLRLRQFLRIITPL